MKKYFLILISLLIVIIFIAPIFLPKKLIVEVERVYKTPVSMVFDEFNNLKKFTKWNAWDKKDPKVELTFFPPYVGEGALYKWQSEKQEVGEGQMEIVSATENSQINSELKFKGWDDKSLTKVVFKSISEQETKVIWKFEGGGSSYFLRYANVFFKQFLLDGLNESLNNLEKVLLVKKSSPVKPIVLSVGNLVVENFIGVKYLGIRVKTSSDINEQVVVINESVTKIIAHLIKEKKIKPLKIGKTVVYYQQNDTINKKSDFYVGVSYEQDFFVEENKSEAKEKLAKKLKEQKEKQKKLLEIAEDKELKTIEKSEFESFIIPRGQAVVTLHKGQLNKIKNTQNLVERYLKVREFTAKPRFWYELQDSYLDSVKDISIKIYTPTE